MIKLLKKRKLQELLDARPMDGDYFVIMPDRPEGSEWIRHDRTRYSKRRLLEWKVAGRCCGILDGSIAGMVTSTQKADVGSHVACGKRLEYRPAD